MISPNQQQLVATFIQQLIKIHQLYFTSPTSTLPPFQQIDHGPPQLCPSLFSLQQNCLVISFDAFEKYYEGLFKMLRNENENITQTLMATNVLLAMNGQNDRALNLKKKYLQQKDSQGKEYLNLEWELVFNAAVCLKCKKSSSYYQYRLRLIQLELNKLFTTQQQTLEITHLKESLQKILERQNLLITRVLARFFRNYFCWMYRIKLFKLIHQKLLLQEQKLSAFSVQQKPSQLFTQQQKPSSIIKSLSTQLTIQQLQNIHTFLSKYCNDYSGYSYLISFTQRYILNNNELKEEEKLSFLEKELQWTTELKEYCEVAYEHQEHYKHLLMYQGHLVSFEEKPNKDMQLSSQVDNKMEEGK